MFNLKVPREEQRGTLARNAENRFDMTCMSDGVRGQVEDIVDVGSSMHVIVQQFSMSWRAKA